MCFGSVRTSILLLTRSCAWGLPSKSGTKEEGIRLLSLVLDSVDDSMHRNNLAADLPELC